MRSLLSAASLALVLCVPASAEEKKEPDLGERLKALKLDDKPFTLIVQLKVKKGQEKAFMDTAKPCIAATRKEKGCVTYRLSQDLEDPTKFVFYERWKSGKALQAHLNAAHTKKLVGALPKFLDGAATFGFYKAESDK